MRRNKIASKLKWVATVLLIVGAFVNALGYYPTGPIILATGGIVWTIVSVLWKEKSLIVTNAVITSVTIVGLLIAI